MRRHRNNIDRTVFSKDKARSMRFQSVTQIQDFSSAFTSYVEDFSVYDSAGEMGGCLEFSCPNIMARALDAIDLFCSKSSNFG